MAHALASQLDVVARIMGVVSAGGGRLVLVWPDDSACWNLPSVQNLVARLGMSCSSSGFEPGAEGRLKLCMLGFGGSGRMFSKFGTDGELLRAVIEGGSSRSTAACAIANACDSSLCQSRSRVVVTSVECRDLSVRFAERSFGAVRASISRMLLGEHRRTRHRRRASWCC